MSLEIILYENNVMVRGQESMMTILNYTGTSSRWSKCYAECWLSLRNLIIASNKEDTFGDTEIQFEMGDGGTLEIINVVFDGNNYPNIYPGWKLEDSGVNVVVEDSYFFNNNGRYYIGYGTTATFRNCVFNYNYIDPTKYGKEQGLFDVARAAMITFENCTFINNTQDGRYLFTIKTGGNVVIYDSIFEGNQGNSSLFYVGTGGKLDLTNVEFTDNAGFSSIIYGTKGPNITITNSTFIDNYNVGYDIYIENTPDNLYYIRSGLSISGSLFREASEYIGSIYFGNILSARITNTIWRGYGINDAILSNDGADIELDQETIPFISNSEFIGASGLAASLSGALFGAASKLIFDNVEVNAVGFRESNYVISGARLLFNDCRFIQNQVSGSIFHISNGALYLYNTSFVSNRGFADGGTHHVIEVSDGEDADWLPSTANETDELYIYGCTFDAGSFTWMTSMITATNNTWMEIYIEDTDFVDSCDDDYCLVFLDANLYIDQASTSNAKTLLFGHPADNGTYIWNISDIWIFNDSNGTYTSRIPYNDIVPLQTLYLIDYDPLHIETAIDFINFGAENGSVIFEPCEEWDDEDFPRSLFNVSADGLLPSNEYTTVAEFIVIVEIKLHVICIRMDIDIITCSFFITFDGNIG